MTQSAASRVLGNLIALPLSIPSGLAPRFCGGLLGLADGARLKHTSNAVGLQIGLVAKAYLAFDDRTADSRRTFVVISRRNAETIIQHTIGDIPANSCSIGSIS
jgi:hypothetical protein